MKLNRRGQVSPEVILIAAACAGLWYGGYYTVKGVKAVGHAIAKPFHHRASLPLVQQPPKPPSMAKDSADRSSAPADLAGTGMVVKEKPCQSTTMDGLPNCPMPKMTSAECLATYPPHEVGDFCDWYGYATPKEEEDFERTRGFQRKAPYDSAEVNFWVRIQ